MTILKFLLLGLVFLALTFAAIVRVRPIDPAVWHVRPDTLMAGQDGQFIAADAGDTEAVLVAAPVDEVAGKLAGLIMQRPRVAHLAGALEEGFASYVERSQYWAFPDVLSVTLTDEGGGTRVEMVSRLVYGKYDFGVNEARVRSLLDALTD